MTELGAAASRSRPDHAGEQGGVASRVSPRRAAGAANSNASHPRKARPPKDCAAEPASAGDIAASDIAEYAARLGITVERVLVEYARIAFADIRQVLTWGPDGVVLKPPAG